MPGEAGGAGRPRVALIGGDGGPSGVPTHLRHLARALSPVAEVTVVSEPDRGGYGWTGAAGVPHVAVAGLASSADPRRVAAAWSGLGAALEALAPDLVWAHARLSLPLGRLLARRCSWRLMATYHGLPFGPGHGLLRSAISRGAEAALLRIAPPHDVVFLTPEDRDAFPAGLLRRHRSHVLPNASALGGFAPRPGAPGPLRLLMLTRAARQKDLPLAARILAAMGPGVELRLLGTGTDAPGLRARLAPLLGEALGRVRFEGPTADVRPALAEADLLLVTSRYEGLSIAALEAMEWGLPVASTPVGGLAHLGRVHPMLARLDPSDPAGSAQAVRALAQAFRADRERLAARIHAAWEGAFSPAAFDPAARAVLARAMRPLVEAGP